MEARAKGWMVASAAMLSLSILVAVGPVISSAIGNRPLSEAYGTIPSQGNCSEKLKVYVDSYPTLNAIFKKNIRDHFETQTGCLVEKTPIYGMADLGNYAQEFFPLIEDVNYAVLDARQTRVGGSYGSIPAWTLQLRVEYEIEDKPEWGLCSPTQGDRIIFSGDWAEPSWAANALDKYGPGYYNFLAADYSQDAQYMSRYSISYEMERVVSDQMGPILQIPIFTCGVDDIFQNSINDGVNLLWTTVFLDPADLKPYNIPFYSWMGW